MQEHLHTEGRRDNLQKGPQTEGTLLFLKRMKASNIKNEPRVA